MQFYRNCLDYKCHFCGININISLKFKPFPADNYNGGFRSIAGYISARDCYG